MVGSEPSMVGVLAWCKLFNCSYYFLLEFVSCVEDAVPAVVRAVKSPAKSSTSSFASLVDVFGVVLSLVIVVHGVEDVGGKVTCHMFVITGDRDGITGAEPLCSLEPQPDHNYFFFAGL